MRTDDVSASPSSIASSRIGVIGLGSMGLPMAQHLLAAHGKLTVHSRTLQSSIVDAGATWADSPRVVAENCDAVLVMLPDLPQLEAMLDGPDGLLTDGTDLLIMIGSTASPTGVRALASALIERTGTAVRVVDCPVSGGEEGAVAGTLSIMVGGCDDDVTVAARILRPCGTVHHMGPIGAGQVAKACNQMIVASTMLALAEATVLAERSGISPNTLFDVLEGGYAGSALLRAKRSRLASADDAPGGMAKYMVKDLSFVEDLAAETRTNTALIPTLRKTYSDLIEAGLGDRDLSVVRRFIAANDRPEDEGAARH